MGIACLMVHVGLDHAGRVRLDLACHLARGFDALLAGAAAVMPVMAHPSADPLSDPGGDLGADLPDGTGLVTALALGACDRAEQEVQRARTLFAAVAAQHGCRTGWQGSLGYPSESLLRQAVAADLLVVGPAGPNRHTTPDPQDLLARLGRPLLVVPPNPARPLPDRPALVAWKDGPACRRAVQDALPLLRQAPVVTVVALVPEAGLDDAEAAIGPVLSHLARHQVAARGIVEPCLPGRSTSAQLLNVARQEDAGLLVLGGAGRAAPAGGTTLALLQDSDICLLLSR